MKFLRKNPFMFLFIALLILLVLFAFVRNKKLSDELKLVKQEKRSYVKELEGLNLQLKQQHNFIEDKDELYAKLAAELHKERQRLKELEAATENLKTRRK